MSLTVPNPDDVARVVLGHRSPRITEAIRVANGSEATIPKEMFFLSGFFKPSRIRIKAEEISSPCGGQIRAGDSSCSTTARK